MDRRQDLSSSAIRRAVLGHSLQHPSVIYPAALSVLGGIGVSVIGGAPMLLGAVVVTGGMAVAALATHYFARYDKIAGSYLETVRRQLTGQREEHIADLAGDLKAVRSDEASRQLQRLVDKMGTFQAVLGERLSPNELTFARFSAIAEAVFLAGIDNLRAVHLALVTLQGIDEPYLSQRLAELEQRTRGDMSAEMTGLTNQLEQAAVLRERIRMRMGQNELAMAELDKATSAVGEMRTGADRPSLDMEAAMQELARIAKRSADY